MKKAVPSEQQFREQFEREWIKILYLDCNTLKVPGLSSKFDSHGDFEFHMYQAPKTAPIYAQDDIQQRFNWYDYHYRDQDNIWADFGYGRHYVKKYTEMQECLEMIGIQCTKNYEKWHKANDISKIESFCFFKRDGNTSIGLIQDEKYYYGFRFDTS